MLGEVGNVPSSDLLRIIRTPLETLPIPRLGISDEGYFEAQLLSSLLVLGGGIMSLHYNRLTTMFSGCPIVVAMGQEKLGSPP